MLFYIPHTTLAFSFTYCLLAEDCSVTAGKFDKLLHLSSVSIARKFIIGLTIRVVEYHSKNYYPKPNIFTE
jgi:hypothetical protein